MSTIGSEMGCTIEMVKANLAHREDVMKVSKDVYAGLDYLPSLYNSWIEEGDRKDPRRFNFVVLLDLEVCGFFSLLFSADKSKFLSSAIRVAETHRCKGVGMKSIGEFQAKFVRSVNPDIEKLYSFADAWLENPAVEKILRTAGGSLVQLSCPLLNFQPKFVTNLEGGGDTQLCVAEENFLHNVLTSPWNSLLSNSFLHVNWDPYCPSRREDIDYILEKKPTIVKGRDSFSIFSPPIDIPAGHRIGLDIYADSVETFLDHVKFQLKNFAKDRDSEQMFKLFIFSPVAYTEALLDLLKTTMKISEDSFLSLGSVARDYPSMFICKEKP